MPSPTISPITPPSAPAPPAAAPPSGWAAFRRLWPKLLLGALPLAVLLGLYVLLDPFKVLYYYEEYYPPVDQGVILNRDIVSTDLYLRQADQYHYNAFIFGNSRSLSYRTAEWQKYLPAGSVPFHFDANAETLFGLERKVTLIDERKGSLHSALIILDHDFLAETTDSKGHLFMKHRALSGVSWFAYQAAFVRSYFKPIFQLALIKRVVLGDRKRDTNYFRDARVTSRPDHNDFEQTVVDSILAVNPEAHYQKVAHVFHPRPTTEQVADPVIGPAQRALLTRIQAVFRRQGTDARIIINPLYDQRRLNPADVAALKSYFGTDKVFDFSGINAYTADFHNYYESSHYRPHVARDIMRRVYAGQPTP